MKFIKSTLLDANGREIMFNQADLCVVLPTLNDQF